MQVVDSEGYLKVKLVGGPVGPFVPYTGATANVDLGEYEIKAGQVEFDQTPTGTTGVATMRWNDQDGTADLGLKGGNVTLQIGQEQVTRVVNKTGVNLLEANYQAVRVDGAQGNRLKVALAQADNDANSADTLGLVTETINDNQEGFVTTSGLVRNIDTTGTLQGETWADGNVLYLSGTTAGRVTNIKPAAPIHTVIMGYVVRAHATQGQIYVKVDNGYELDELHNVSITTPLNNQVLQYESATSLWKNKTISTGITIGSTAIASGVVGRVLFEGAGNVVQESSSLAYDDTLKTFTLIGPIGSVFQHTALTNYNGFGGFQLNVADGTERAFVKLQPNSGEFKIGTTSTGGYFTTIHSGGSEAMRIATTRNILIGTTTDAGFRLDVNGTARVSGALTASGSIISNGTIRVTATTASPSGNASFFVFDGAEGTNFAYDYGTSTYRALAYNGSLVRFLTAGTERARFAITTGNFLIGTTTDAGFRLDVNGTARVSGNLTCSGSLSVSVSGIQVASGGNGIRWGSNVFAISSVNGVLKFSDNSDADFNRLQFGGTTSAFPSIKRASNNIEIKNADDTFGAGLSVGASLVASAILQADSTTKGFLPPRMTTTQKNAIASPATGLQVYDTTLNQMSYYNGTTWTNI